MIRVTRLDGKEVLVNPDLVLSVEETPDTVLTFSTGLHMVVTESAQEVVDRTVAYRRRVLAGPTVISRER